MTYEFIIRDVKTKVDVRSCRKVVENRYEYVKSLFEKELKRFDDPDYVLLINKCDDEGNFEEIVQ